MVLPYINLPENRVLELLNSIGDTLVSAAKTKEEKKRFAAEQLMKQQGQARQDDLAQAQMANYQSEADMRKAQADRAAAGEKRQTGLDVASAIPKIKSMLTPGSTDYDPESAISLARAHGINLAATQPTPPVEPKIGPTAVEEGPRETPEIAQQAALQRSIQNVPGDASPQAGAAEDQRQIDLAETERKRFAEANNPEAVQRNKLQGQMYADQVAAYRTAQPTYKGTSPIGDVSIDPNAALQARQFSLDRQRREMAPLMNIPGMEKYAPGIQAAIASGAKPEQVNALVQKAIEDQRKDEEKSQYSLTAEEQLRHQRETERIGWANAGSHRDTGDDRKKATAEKEQDKLDSTTVRDENGNPIGYVPTGKGGAQGFATRDADYKRALEQLSALQSNVNDKGERVFWPSNVKDRNSLKHNADIAVATVSPLGKTNEAMKAESESIGRGGGLGFNADALVGANPEAIQRKLEEIKAQRDRYRAETLIPMREGNPLTRAAPGVKADNPLTRAAKGKGKQGPRMSDDDILKAAGAGGGR